jgi:hypothetical protein
MLTQTISFEDFNGTRQTRDFHFHMTKADIAEFMLGKSKDFPAYMDELVKQENIGEIIQVYKALVRASIGKKSDDGVQFVKTSEFTDTFMNSNAYSDFFMDMMTDTKKMVEFFKGVMPKDLAEAYAKQVDKPQPRNNNQTGAKRKKNKRPELDAA